MYFLGVLGLLFGSFSNMLIYRLSSFEPVQSTRSRCIHCHTALPIRSLVPVLSYLIQSGRCLFCDKRIPLRYLLVELVMGIGFILIWILNLPLIETIKLLIFFFAGLTLFVIDLKSKRLPDLITLPLLIIGLAFAWNQHTLLTSVMGACLGFSIYFTIRFIGRLIYKQEVMGGGDLKLGAALGSYWGIEHILMTSYLSFLLGGLVSLCLLLLKKCSRRDHIPFGPFILLGSCISLFFFDAILTLIYNPIEGFRILQQH